MLADARKKDERATGRVLFQHELMGGLGVNYKDALHEVVRTLPKGQGLYSSLFGNRSPFIHTSLSCLPALSQTHFGRSKLLTMKGLKEMHHVHGGVSPC
jgi:hypothetical protein